MSERTCTHAGWGDYPGEEGPQPEPTKITVYCETCFECPTCKTRVVIVNHGHSEASGPSYLTQMLGGIETR